MEIGRLKSTGNHLYATLVSASDQYEPEPVRKNFMEKKSGRNCRDTSKPPSMR